MDTTTLVVGQDVRMISGPYFCQGRVVKVTPEGVEVEIDSPEMRLKFDKDGKECTFDKQKFPNAWMGTYECGPWELIDPEELKEERLK